MTYTEYKPGEHRIKGLKGDPSKWLERFLPLLPAGAKVLDYACGAARNDRLLSKAGFLVTAADIDPRVAPYAEVIPNTTFVCTDLEHAPWPFAPESFDLVLVNYYLFRPRLKEIANLIKPGGWLIYETFMKPYPEFDKNRARNDDFILRPMELPQTFAGLLDCIAYEESLIDAGDCVQHYLGRKALNGRFEPVTLP
jgi:SAM-dependent methyltransferase